jgi:peptidoglycan/xylan/chitin deacetylase (PgdA/CDA1 family)
MSIGAHTINHVSLATLTLQEQLREVIDCRAALATILGEPPAGIAYPYGSLQDYDGRTLQAVAQGAYEWGCTTNMSSPRGDDLPFELPRRCVRNWDEQRFAGWLRRRLG